jgi:hypothetical protein
VLKVDISVVKVDCIEVGDTKTMVMPAYMVLLKDLLLLLAC